MAKVNNSCPINYRFSGHDSFVCRYSWIPKAVNAIQDDPSIFADEEKAIIAMGVGKNMVKSMKFWAEVMGIIQPASQSKNALTDFGKIIFDCSTGHHGCDPYLEDIRTLWLLHWKLSSHVENPVFAWDYMMNKWHTPEICLSKVIPIYIEEAAKLSRDISADTIKDHFSIFLHTYVQGRTHEDAILEDSLDSPLIELNLIRKAGERIVENTGKRELVYAFNKEEKPDITPALFLYALLDFKERRLPNSQKLSFNQIANGHGSPGQIFKLPESSIRERLEKMSALTHGALVFKDASNEPHVSVERNKLRINDLLTSVYQD